MCIRSPSLVKSLCFPESDFCICKIICTGLSKSQEIQCTGSHLCTKTAAHRRIHYHSDVLKDSSTICVLVASILGRQEGEFPSLREPAQASETSCLGSTLGFSPFGIKRRMWGSLKSADTRSAAAQPAAGDTAFRSCWLS